MEQVAVAASRFVEAELHRSKTLRLLVRATDGQTVETKDGAVHPLASVALFRAHTTVKQDRLLAYQLPEILSGKTAPDFGSTQPTPDQQELLDLFDDKLRELKEADYLTYELLMSLTDEDLVDAARDCTSSKNRLEELANEHPEAIELPEDLTETRKLLQMIAEAGQQDPRYIDSLTEIDELLCEARTVAAIEREIAARRKDGVDPTTATDLVALEAQQQQTRKYIEGDAEKCARNWQQGNHLGLGDLFH